MKNRIMSLAFGIAIVFSSCNEDEVNPLSNYATPTDFNVTVESVVTADVAVEDAVESIDYEVDLFTGTADMIGELSAKSMDSDQLKSSVADKWQDRYANGEAPDITIDWTDGGYPCTITLDYGEETTLANGRIISGTMAITLSGSLTTEGATRTATFTDLTVDSLTVNGTIEKNILSVTEEREVYIVRDLEFTLPDSTTLNCYDEITRTWEQGIGTPFYYVDDVMTINGYGTCTDSDGNQYRRDITKTLQKQGGCRYLVSGTVSYAANGLTFGTVDYGDGTCDNIGTFTSINGETEFIIGKRVRERISNRNKSEQ
ncbi:hypothetical protein ACT3CD_09005 [Geofilum sp. OHC36d9]|uniref:hypothetical protein n=1 Tax=Geofilum sp. OHC36d9 TaxID=3458413 RepID=UPI004033749C